jgi:hypothetical protein
MPEAHTNMPGLRHSVVHATIRETWCRAPATSRKRQAASVKQQATSYARFKLQAASFKQGWFESFKPQAAQGASDKRQAPSSKHQAASHELLAL